MTVTVTILDGVAAVVLDNPAQRNALTRDMCLDLQELMPRLDQDPDVRIVTLRGVGMTFSAGASLGELASVLLDPQEDGSLVDQLSRADAAVTSVSKPTIALVDGACVGGGWQLASACDFIVASERSVFAITPAKLGIIYPRPGIERLVRLVGPATAKFILFTAQMFTALEAQGLGLVAEVVPDEGHFVTLTKSLLKNSTFTIHTLKRLIELTTDDDPRLDAEWESAWLAMTDSPDMDIGVSAFLNRETPRFAWRPTE